MTKGSEGVRIWLVGCGNMGSAILRGWLAEGMSPAMITVIDPTLPSVADGVTVIAEPRLDARAPDVAVLCVKPQSLDDVAPLLAPHLDADTLLLSILAGAEIATLRERFPAPRDIVRIMPNLPASIGKGVAALYSSSDDDRIRVQAEALMRPLGAVEWIKDEALFNAITALSGCGPGFVFRFIDALAHAGTALGLPADQAERLAMHTVIGSALLAEQSTETPTQLADRVASPGGSTRKGLDVLDRDGALDALISATLSASAHRNAEMTKAARG